MAYSKKPINSILDFKTAISMFANIPRESLHTATKLTEETMLLFISETAIKSHLELAEENQHVRLLAIQPEEVSKLLPSFALLPKAGLEGGSIQKKRAKTVIELMKTGSYDELIETFILYLAFFFACHINLSSSIVFYQTL